MAGSRARPATSLLFSVFALCVIALSSVKGQGLGEKDQLTAVDEQVSKATRPEREDPIYNDAYEAGALSGLLMGAGAAVGIVAVEEQLSQQDSQRLSGCWTADPITMLFR